MGEHNQNIDQEFNLIYTTPEIFARKNTNQISLEKPLHGLTVLDFSQFLSGPSASLRMADLGARVIKVERPDVGDICRTLYISNLELDGESTLFHSINRNKESFSADLKDAGDFEKVKELIRKADVVIQNFRPGVMARIGLDYEKVKNINPQIIYGEITGYGTEGPWKEKPGQDLLVQSLSGTAWIGGEHDHNPSPMGLASADMFTGAHLVQGVLAGLIKRNISGKGCHVEVSLLESILDLQFEKLTAYLNKKDSKPLEYTNYSGIYETADGYIALEVGDIKEMNEILDHSTCQTDDIKHGLKTHLLSKTSKEWISVLKSANYSCSEVLNWNQMMKHEGFKVLDMVQEVWRSSGASMNTTRCPIRVDEQIFTSLRGSPRIGEHNTEILKELDQ